MKLITQSLAAGLLAALPLSLHARIDRTVEKTFAVQPGGQLSVSTQGGDIQVVTGSGQEIRVVAKQHFPRADTDAEADEILRNMTFEMTQSGNDVTIVTKRERTGGFTWGSQVSFDFIITVPEKFNAELRTSGGDIQVDKLAGKLNAHTSGGDVDVVRVDGEVSVSTSGGDITLKEGTGSARLSTSGGDVTVGRVAGPVDIETSGGDIDVAADSGPVDASTSGGDITARLTGKAGFHLDASTSGGDVDAHGLTITIERGGTGKSRLVGNVNGGGPLVKLRTSGGDINVSTR